MGVVGSVAIEDEQQLAAAGGGARTEFLRRLAEENKEEDQKDFYQLFGLERYVEIKAEVRERLNGEFERLMDHLQSDSNASSYDRVNVNIARIKLGKFVLEDPDLKRRYDEELREQLGEGDGWSTFRWWARWGWNAFALLLGSSAIMVGVHTVPAACVVGAALLASGLRGTFKMLDDLKCSDQEFLKDILSALAMGGVAAPMVVAAAPAVACASTAVGTASAVCAGAKVSAELTSNAIDLLITKGAFGDTMKGMCIDCKTWDDVFSGAHCMRLLFLAFAGAAFGAGLEQFSNIMPCSPGLTDAQARLEALFTATCWCASLPFHRTTLRDRIEKLAPDAVHRLVDDASQAHFMVSRTNIQRGFADGKVVQLLRDGFKLCADNSLAGGWGGRGWVDKYVSDSQKTRFGIIVLEGGQGFFRSRPCCDELYAAKEAGVNLTKVHGKSIRSGGYLWVNISTDTFSSSAEYEQKMRPEHGEQYTPHFHTATLGSDYKSDLNGTRFTYYCIVPVGRAANATGASNQRF